MTFHGFDGIRSTQPTVPTYAASFSVRRGTSAWQQAPVRRGPYASATSLVTVSLTESEINSDNTSRTF